MSCTSSRYLSVRKNKSSRLTDCENKFAHAILCPTQWFIMAIFSASVVRQVFDSLSLIHTVVSLTICKQPLPKRGLQGERSTASSYSFFSLRSSSSCLRLIPRLRFTSILPSIFHSITCFRMQFLRKIRPMQLALILLILFRTLQFPLTLCNTLTFLPRQIQLIYILLHHHISKLSGYFWSTFQSLRVSEPYKDKVRHVDLKYFLNLTLNYRIYFVFSPDKLVRNEKFFNFV